jgi:integrase
MAKILFYPEKRKNDQGLLIVKNVPLLLFFSFEGNRLQYYTGERIDLKDWDFENRKVLSTHSQYVSINEHLEFLKLRMLEAYRNLKLSGLEVSLPVLRKKLKELLKKGNASFFELLILFIEEKNQEWTLTTYRKIKSFYNHMRNFRNKTGIEPDLNAFDENFYKELINYFRTECQHLDSTIRKNLEVLLWFMNWAYKKGFLRDNDFRKQLDRFRSLNDTIKEDVMLSFEELKALKSFITSGKKEMLARDIFVFSCFTGLSCDEIRQLRPVDIEDDWIKVNSGKRTRSVPLSEDSKIIIARYLKSDKLTVFPKIYPAKINRYLKEMGKKTSLLREIKITRYIDGQSSDASSQAYRLLTLSVAKKTFIHLALQLGISPYLVAQTAGYKTMNAVDLHSKKTEQLKLEEFKKFNI